MSDDACEIITASDLQIVNRVNIAQKENRERGHVQPVSFMTGVTFKIVFIKACFL